MLLYCPVCTCEQMYSKTPRGKKAIILLQVTHSQEPPDRKCYYCDGDLLPVTDKVETVVIDYSGKKNTMVVALKKDDKPKPQKAVW